LVAKPIGNILLGKPRHKQNNIKVDHKETGWRSLVAIIWHRRGIGGGERF
jgi:hypothetical protein